eukprot:TRINITY_DN1317_c0_g5_i1.p1 TRINITY_DN1317_c0_g5~~TRINITY_DN1317_c0_g5_i1.p1  ORF type:complete len:587 (-),score=298.27 TRINITY_DN1317_c0_g5_i1:991-2751(-)
MAASKEISNKEISFGKRLAAVDKATRDQGVRVLSRWLAKQQHTTELEMMKIWRGLFYCMWLSDKPLVQQELAESLAKLVHSLPNDDSALLFIQAFWRTIEQQWHTLDRLRLDKFYSLLRRFVEQSLRLLKRRHWAGGLVSRYNAIVCACPLRVRHDELEAQPTAVAVLPAAASSQPQPQPLVSGRKRKHTSSSKLQASSSAAATVDGSTCVAPVGGDALPGQLGIKLHLISIFLDELRRVAPPPGPPAGVVLQLVEPWLMLLAHGRDPMLFERVVDDVVGPLMPDTSDATDAADTDTDSNTAAPNVPAASIDLTALAARLLQIASSAHITERNRPRLYKLRQRVLDRLASLPPQPAALDPDAAAAAASEPDTAPEADPDPTDDLDANPPPPQQQQQREPKRPGAGSSKRPRRSSAATISSSSSSSTSSSSSAEQPAAAAADTTTNSNSSNSGSSKRKPPGGGSTKSATAASRKRSKKQQQQHGDDASADDSVQAAAPPESPQPSVSVPVAGTTSAKKKVVIALAKNRFQELNEHYILAQSASPQLRNMTKTLTGILKKSPAPFATPPVVSPQRAKSQQRKTAKDFF